MPLSNADNPAAEPVEAVVDAAVESSPRKAAKAAAAKVEEPAVPVLARAFTSGNAEVHNLVAEWEIASSNQDKAHLAEVEAKLAALGYRI